MHRVFTDMLGKEVVIAFPPKRIVSLVPSQTELLHDLGLEDEVVGITKFCVHPEKWFRSKLRVGGTKQLHIEKIRAIQPDLIIANKEENTQAQVEELAREFPVWTSDISNVTEAVDMIRNVGKLVGREEQALAMTERITHNFSVLSASTHRRSAAYFIWYRPWMTVGGDTFIGDILRRIGLQNVFESSRRYPETTIQELQLKAPDLVFLSSEPFPFSEKHVREIESALPGSDVRLVDGEMFSWYGSRMEKAVEYLNSLDLKTQE